jgi:hypothetical protein
LLSVAKSPQVMMKSWEKNFPVGQRHPQGMPIKNTVLASKLASKKSENTFTLVTIITELVVIISLFTMVE